MNYSVAPPRLLVSTVIPAFNAERFIERSLASALAQNIPYSEIIVIDDGSTDATCEIVARYKDRGVRLLSHAKRSGVAAARNTGILASNGEFIAFLDADDEWLPHKLERQLSALRAKPEMKFISCRSSLIDETGRDHGDIYRGARPAVGPEGWRTLLTYPCVATPSVLVRRSALSTAGLFNKWLPVGEDQDMWIRLSMLGEIGHIPEALVMVHSTPNSLSKAVFKEQASYVLPMVAAYLARNEHRLTKAQRRRIMGVRYAKIGQAAYANGELIFGLKTLLRAIAYGNQPLKNVLYIVRASGIVRRLKRVLLRFKR
jgi:glycosyltransferase involved in cell wall biosynthesis